MLPTGSWKRRLRKEVPFGSDDIDVGKIAESLRRQDKALLMVTNGMAEILGLGIANLVNLFNLDTVVLGGAMRPILAYMLEATRATVDHRALKHPREMVRIKVSGSDDDSVFGAAHLVHSKS